MLKQAGLLIERREGTRRLYTLHHESLEPVRELLSEFCPTPSAASSRPCDGPSSTTGELVMTAEIRNDVIVATEHIKASPELSLTVGASWGGGSSAVARRSGRRRPSEIRFSPKDQITSEGRMNSCHLSRYRPAAGWRGSGRISSYLTARKDKIFELAERAGAAALDLAELSLAPEHRRATAPVDAINQADRYRPRGGAGRLP